MVQVPTHSEMMR